MESIWLLSEKENCTKDDDDDEFVELKLLDNDCWPTLTQGKRLVPKICQHCPPEENHRKRQIEQPKNEKAFSLMETVNLTVFYQQVELISTTTKEDCGSYQIFLIL